MASHNPFAALGGGDDSDGEAADVVMASVPSTAVVSVKSKKTVDVEIKAEAASNSRRAQRKAAKRQKRTAADDAATTAPRNQSTTVEVEEEDDETDEAKEQDAEEDVEVEEDDAEQEESKEDGVATSPAEIGLTADEIATTTQTLKLLQTHPALIEHSGFRALRLALAPLVTRLFEKWNGGVATTSTKRAKTKLTAKEQAKLDYELALDMAARNATKIREARLQKLETLNSVVDGDATAEAFKSMRVPDGVAITDGHGIDDVCMKMITDGSTNSKTNGRQLLLTTGTPAAAAASTKGASIAASSTAATAVTTKLIHPIKCYICKTPFKELHHFYSDLCPKCAKLNYAKRELTVDLTGKIILLTGARVKIGYRILTKLLRCGAFVIATTRFPNDLTVRLRLEHDFQTFKSRVHIYGLDFRNLTVLEHFVAMMYQRYSHLDAIINNACQTVRRPPAYYSHLMDGERIAFDDLNDDAKGMLAHHHAFSEQSHQLRLGANEGMMRLESGTAVDVEVPPIDSSSTAPSAAKSNGKSNGVANKPSRSATITIVEEADDDATAEEIVASVASSKRASGSTPAAGKPKATAAAAPAPAPAASATSAAASSTGANASRKRSRREAMRAAAASTDTDKQVVASSAAGTGAQFTTAAALAAESTQLSILASDEYTAEERARLFPQGERDVNGQQLDLRAANSWTMKLAEVPIGEAAEVTAINYLAPFLLNSKLKALMERGNEKKTVPRFIVNVSAMEGKFYRFKSAQHPHTNAAKAALNMMTRTSAQDYVNSMIFMTAVDTGWINDENPLPKAAEIAQKFAFQTPLDEIDAAMRVLDPILTPLAEFAALPKGKTVRDLKIPFGYFIKDYEKCEW